MFPEEIWLAIAEQSYASDIYQLSEALRYTIVSPEFHSRLAWISEYKKGFYQDGCSFIFHLIDRPLPVIQSALRMMNERQRLYVIRQAVKVPENWAMLRCLRLDCGMPSAPMESASNYHLLHGTMAAKSLVPVERLHEFDSESVSNRHRKGELNSEAVLIYRELCSRNTLQLLSEWFMRKAGDYSDHQGFAPGIIRCLPGLNWRKWARESPPDEPATHLAKALHLLMENNEVELVRVLLEAGVSPCWSMYIPTNNPKILFSLLEFGEIPNLSQKIILEEFEIGFIETLIAHGAKLQYLLFRAIFQRLDLNALERFLGNDGVSWLLRESSPYPSLIIARVRKDRSDAAERQVALQMARMILEQISKRDDLWCELHELRMIRDELKDDRELRSLFARNLRFIRCHFNYDAFVNKPGSLGLNWLSDFRLNVEETADNDDYPLR